MHAGHAAPLHGAAQRAGEAQLLFTPKSLKALQLE
jgi:hypothetical protein